MQQIEALRDKLGMESQQLSRAAHLHDQATTRVRVLEDERNILEAKVHKLEAELNGAELARDSLRKDKANVCILLKPLGMAKSKGYLLGAFGKIDKNIKGTKVHQV